MQLLAAIACGSVAARGTRTCAPRFGCSAAARPCRASIACRSTKQSQVSARTIAASNGHMFERLAWGKAPPSPHTVVACAADLGPFIRYRLPRGQCAGCSWRAGDGLPDAGGCTLSSRFGHAAAAPLVCHVHLYHSMPCSCTLQVKLYDTPLVCPTSGCEAILDSEYSSLFGIPLSLLGMVTYATVSGLAAMAAMQGRNSASKESLAAEGSTSSSGSGLLQLDNALLCGVTLLGTCSASLM